MTKTEFAEKIKEELTDYLPDFLQETDIGVVSKVTSNDLTQTGLEFKCKYGEIQTSLYVYIDGLYEKTCHGRYRIDPDDFMYIVDLVTESHTTRSLSQLSDISVDTMDYRQIKDHLEIRVLSKILNASFLSGLVYEELCGDLVRYCVISYSDYVIYISTEMLEAWGISKETLFSDAVKCMKQKEYAFYNPNDEELFLLLMYAHTNNTVKIEDFLNNIWEKEDYLLDLSQFFFIFTGEKMKYGSYAFADTAILNKIQKLINSNFWIIPSSIHEIICIPERFGGMELQKMIHEVNHSDAIKPEDVLSETLYFYSDFGLETAAGYVERVHKIQDQGIIGIPDYGTC